jgi:hypothetical protein
LTDDEGQVCKQMLKSKFADIIQQLKINFLQDLEISHEDEIRPLAVNFF